MNDERLKNLLNKRAESAIPDTLDLRAGIHRSITVKNTKQTRFRLLRPVLVALIIFALATVAYAFYQSRIRPDDGLSAVQADNLVVPINQTHDLPATAEVTDFSITLDSAFADSNRIVVAYHISGKAKAGEAIQIYTNPTLTDAQGSTYYWLPSSGQQASNPTTEGTDPEALMPFRTDGLMSFDSSLWDIAPANVSFSLRIEVAYSSTSVEAASQPLAMKMAGQTSFQFTIPVNPGRVIALNLSATAGQMTLELQKIVVAPSLTRLEFCAPQGTFTGGDDNWVSWLTSLTVDVNGQRVATTSEASFGGLQGQPIQRESGCRSLVIPAQLVTQTGAWQLTINEFANSDSGERLIGPWVFNFNIPS